MNITTVLNTKHHNIRIPKWIAYEHGHVTELGTLWGPYLFNPTTTKWVVHMNAVFNHSSLPNGSSSLKCMYVNVRLDTLEISSTIINFIHLVLMTFYGTLGSDQYSAILYPRALWEVEIAYEISLLCRTQ